VVPTLLETARAIEEDPRGTGAVRSAM
jgi:hypothetical protein